MQIPRFFLAPEDISPADPPGKSPALRPQNTLDLQTGARYCLTNQKLNKQIRQVLRLGRGDRLNLLDGEGGMFECSIEAAGSAAVIFEVVQSRRLDVQPCAQVCVALALLKGERFEWALQKLTELGVSQVVPLITARTVIKVDQPDAKRDSAKLLRWNAILKEAAEQCERATIPRLVAPAKFERWISELDLGGTGDTAYLCAERWQTTRLKDIFLPFACRTKKMLGTADKTIHLIIGPEGGFTPDEIELAQNAGAMPVSLGQRILRAETAAVFSAAQVIWCLEN